MRRILLRAALVAIAAAALAAEASPRLDAAMRDFWKADDEGGRAKAAKRVLASGATFDEILARLRAGRPYGPQKTGRVELKSWDQGAALDNVVESPADYNPARAWPLRVSLHGGVGREPPGPGDLPARPLQNRIPSAGEIVLLPRAWAQSQWWHGGQVENVARLLDRVKRDYNVDESRAYVTGFSDGGTGAYFFAMRAATPWAACMPLHGQPLVLNNPASGADGQLYVGNVVNCPLRIVNGGRDPLYPAAPLEPIIETFRKAGGVLEWKVYPDAGHDMRWWPEERAGYEAFLAAHPRRANPARISWETERTDRYNRFRWLVIDRLGARPSDVPLEDVNTFTPDPRVRAQLFDRSKPSGRVDASRNGNAFDVKTRGVQAFTLLLSPDVVDFAKPVRVAVNGRVAHDAVVKTDAAALLAWAARDHDRTMLYGAELHVVVP